MERKKTVYQLDTPFSVVAWPEVSLEDQDTILELLCNLLRPLGEHRQSHVPPSKGKRARKRMRVQSGRDGTLQAHEHPAPPPPTPEIASSIDIGLAATSRRLEKLSTSGDRPLEPPGALTMSTSERDTYAAIFVARAGQSSAFHCHFPQMVAVASRGQRPQPAIRLIGFSRPCADRLAACVGLPRVSSIGLRNGAPNSTALVDMVRKCVLPVEMAWAEPARDMKFLPTKIQPIETTIGPKKAKKLDQNQIQ